MRTNGEAIPFACKFLCFQISPGGALGLCVVIVPRLVGVETLAHDHALNPPRSSPRLDSLEGKERGSVTLPLPATHHAHAKYGDISFQMSFP